MSIRIEAASDLAVSADPSSGGAISQELIETATYLRAGSDLVLETPGGGQIVVEGYFNSTPPPALIADNGAWLAGETVSLLAGPGPVELAQAGGTPSVGAADAIGQIETLEGTASVQRASGGSEDLNIGTPVYQGDVVEVSQQGKLGITFEDGSVFSLSSGGTMVLNEMVYDADSSTSNKMFFSLVNGSLGFVTGAIAGTGGVEVDTPVAVMAIRGTSPLAVDMGNGQYAILSAEGNYQLVNKLDGNEVVVSDSGGVHVYAADGSSQIVPLADTGLEGAVGALINELRSITQKKVEREANDTGNLGGEGESDFGSLEGEAALLALAKLLAPLLVETDLELEADESGNYPPVFLIVDSDTATPPPALEVDGGLVIEGTITVFDANLPDAVDLEVVSVVASGKTDGLESSENELLAMLLASPDLSDADPGDFTNI